MSRYRDGEIIKFMKHYFFKIIASIFLVFLPLICGAFTIEETGDAKIYNDFILSPAKVELSLSSGEQTAKNLQIINRSGRIMLFTVSMEDFTGSVNGQESVILSGDQKTIFSLSDYLAPEVKEFELQHGQRMILPVKVSLPQVIEPQGLYGAILIQAQEKNNSQPSGQISVANRLSSLFFVRVKGEVKEDGLLEKFQTIANRKIFFQSPIEFSLLYRNRSNVHLNPYGLIEVRDIFGSKIKQIEVEPYFVMPQSLRSREFKVENFWGVGPYTVSLFLNRGYRNIIDKAEIKFWFLPWQMLAVLGGIIFLVLVLILFFKIKAKKRLKK